MLSDKQVLLQARKRYTDAKAYWSEQHSKTNELMSFIAGEQWTHTARQNFENAGFAAITSNRLPTFIRQITNELIKNPPQGMVDPKSDGDEQKAEILNDLVRNIQEESSAQEAYIKAAEQACGTGIGYFRLLTEYQDLSSFDKELKYSSIDDPNLVMLDPHHTGLCGEDAEFAFLSTVLSKDEYLQRYTKTKLSRLLTSTPTNDDIKDISWSGADRKWSETDSVIINEYYFKDYEKRTLYQLYNTESGETFIRFEAPDAELVKVGLIQVLQSRQVDVPLVRWCKLNDVEVLESTEWPGEHLPIVAVKGEEYWVDGKRKLVGAVEPALDAQQQLNYAKSWLAQLLQMMPKAPFIGTAVQFKNYEDMWANANVSNQAFLPFNADPLFQGRPERDTGGMGLAQGALALIETAENDMRSIFGTFDPDQKNDAQESGKAILARQDQSYNSNYHFYSHLAKAVEHSVCLLIQAIPVIYDAPRSVQLLAEDGKKRTVSINTPNEQGVVEYDMTLGEYSVSIQTGPAFGTKRQETATAGMALIEAYPNAAPAIADIMVRNMDWPGAQQMADSMEAMVPPQILAARKTDPKNAAAQLPGLMAQVQALTQEKQQLEMNLQEATLKLKEGAGKVEIEMMKAQVDEKKINADALYNKASLEQEAQKTELEFLVREQELKLANAQLELQRAQLGIKGVQVEAEMRGKDFERSVGHLDKMKELADVRVDDTPADTAGTTGALE